MSATPLRRWCVMLHALWTCALLLLLLGNHAPARAADGLLLTEATVARADGEHFPEQASTRTARLPETWDRALHGDGPVWYRLAFRLQSVPSGQVLGAYLESVCAGFDLQLNGQLVHRQASRTQRFDHGCLEPVLVQLPPALLVAGVNLIDIRLHGQPLQSVALRERAATLGPLRIAPPEQLHAQMQTRNLLQRDLPLLLIGIVGAGGALVLALALLGRTPYLGFLGATALGWALLLGLAGAELPLPDAWGEWLLGSLPAPVLVCASVFLLRYCGIRLPWLEYILWLQCLMVPLSLLAGMPERIHLLAQTWHQLLLAELLLSVALFLWRAWQHSRQDFMIVATAVAILLLALGAELNASGPVPLPGKIAVSLALLTILGGLSQRLVEVFKNALQTAENAKAELEQRVQQITADMEQNFGQMAEMRVEQVAAKERKRIAADLHDDLGAKLLTIVHTSDNERIATLAREALEEMRLSVRGLAGKAVQLGDALGDWRSEVMGRLSQSPIELTWNIADELLMSERKMSARVYVQTTRILREAVSNLIKHSGASQCEISVRVESGEFDLTIIDNGKGIPMELDGKLDRGHGMSTMKSRAKQLQGQCLVESGPGFGTTIRLTLPL